MKTFKLLLATLLLATLCRDVCAKQGSFNNATSLGVQQREFRIVETFTVNAVAARFIGVYPNQSFKYTGRTTLKVGIYNDGSASVIGIGKNLIPRPYPIRVAVFQNDYTFECSTGQIIYCFNTSRLE
jgi:hypothetical protein